MIAILENLGVIFSHSNFFLFHIIFGPISEVRTDKQANKQTIYVSKTLLYEKEKNHFFAKKAFVWAKKILKN